ncbi:MAG: SAF domain-containing protein, partial [Chloroflexota bacterium]
STPDPDYIADAFYPVVVPVRSVWRGETLTRDDLTTIQIRGDILLGLLENPRNSLVVNPNELVGQTVRCDLGYFQPIYAHRIGDPLDDPMTIFCGTIPRAIPLAQFRTVGVPVAAGEGGRLFVEVPIGSETLMLPVVDEAEIAVVEDDQVFVRVPDTSRTASVIWLVLDNGGTLTLSPQSPNEQSIFEQFDAFN